MSVDVATLTSSPQKLCATEAGPEDSAPSEEASVVREGNWVVVTRSQRPSENRVETLVRYVSVDEPSQTPIDVGCGKRLVLTSNSPKSGARRSPVRIVADALSSVVEIGDKPVTLVDFHEDWEGGSGGTFVTAQILQETLQIIETLVSPGGSAGEHRTTRTIVYDLRGIVRETLRTSACDVVLRAVPR